MRLVPKNKWWQFNKHEFEAPKVRGIMTKERASESGRSTSKDKDHHGYERSYDQTVTIDHEEWCICGWSISGKEWETDCRMQEEARWRILDERPWGNTLFPRSGSMEKFRRNLSQLGKVCNRDIEKIWYVGL